VSTDAQEVLKIEIAKVLREELGKEEQGLFIGFEHLDALYRAGIRENNAATVLVHYIGRFSLSEKRAVTARICRLLTSCLGLDAQKIIVLFREMESADWGRAAGEYS
jgi:phenylpyruvate tautomerase PptA (4-oxalocrotonate tautomerase family)